MSRDLEVSGTIRGPVDLATETVTFGPIDVTSLDGEIRFTCRLDDEATDLQTMTTVIERVCCAVESGVFAATGMAVRANVQGYSYRNPKDPSLRIVVVQRATRWAVLSSIEESSVGAAWAAEVVLAVLKGSDERLGELLRVYHLGV